MTTTLPAETLALRPDPVKAFKAIRVYLRQSTDQEHQRESVPTQRAECARLALALGITGRWADRNEYVDLDRSGDDFAGREELQRLLREAQPGDVVLAWKQDRVGRDMIDSAATIRELVKYRGCSLYTVETGTVPVSMDSAEQSALVMFRGMVAQGELERIRSRTRDGLRQRARDGFAANAAPFGYRNVLVDPTVKERKQSKKKIEIDQTHAPIIRRIFTMYLDGLGYVSIVNALNREGAPSPRGEGWTRSTVWYMLREPRYAGEWIHGRKRVIRREGKVSYEAAPESEIIRVPRPDLAIITQEVWARVQAKLAERARPMNKRFQPKAAQAPYTGTLRCGECDGPMKVIMCHGRRADWWRRYYVCSNHKRKLGCTNETHARADEIEPKLTEHIRTTVLSELEAKLRENIHLQVQNVVETSAARASEAEVLRAEIESLKRERQRLVRLAAATDQGVTELSDALNANQERAKVLELAFTVATRPPLDGETAAKLEAAAITQIERMRVRLDEGETREAVAVLFPAGLRFKMGPGLWLIEAVASAPIVHCPDAVRHTHGARQARASGRDSRSRARRRACR